MKPVDVRARQTPLRDTYRRQPQAARVVDHATVRARDLHDPLHGRVHAGSEATAAIDYAVHHAIGGLHDAPVPGDLLCAALASCQESSLRMVANVYGVVLTSLAVDVQAEVDVRGTLGMNPAVPVAFTAVRIQVRVQAAPGTPAQRLRQVCRTAERACVVLQTLRAGVPVRIDLDSGVAEASVGPGVRGDVGA